MFLVKADSHLMKRHSHNKTTTWRQNFVTTEWNRRGSASRQSLKESRALRHVSDPCLLCSMNRQLVAVCSLLEMNWFYLFNSTVSTEQLMKRVSANPLICDLKSLRYRDVKLKEKLGYNWRGTEPYMRAFLYVLCSFINKVVRMILFKCR
jgi:hypothetical protein